MSAVTLNFLGLFLRARPPSSCFTAGASLLVTYQLLGCLRSATALSYISLSQLLAWLGVFWAFLQAVLAVERWRLFFACVPRTYRLGSWVLRAGLSYKLQLKAFTKEQHDTEAYQDLLSALHTRWANDLLRVCKANGEAGQQGGSTQLGLLRHATRPSTCCVCTHQLPVTTASATHAPARTAHAHTLRAAVSACSAWAVPAPACMNPALHATLSPRLVSPCTKCRWRVHQNWPVCISLRGSAP